MKEIFLTANSDELLRVDRFITENVADLTRNAVSKLIESGFVTIGGKSLAKSYRVKSGDEIKITLPELVTADIKGEDIPLDIVFEDECLLVINKPKGMVVHPAPGNYSGTLVNALLHHCEGSLSGINGVIRPGIVHRIDKDTSGLLVAAKNDAAHNCLARQIKEHSFLRGYEAIVDGVVKDERGSVDAPIGRHPVKRKQMAVTDKNSKPAVTHYSVLRRFAANTHIELRLQTGRTHQIRVHMAYIGRPVTGDPVYNTIGKGKKDGQLLHAKKIGFVHPSGEYLEFEQEVPDVFRNFLNRIKK